MQILLDTHIFIWWLKNDRQLSKKSKAIITNADTVYISSVSIWEAAIKIQLGKLDVNIHELIAAIETEGFIELPLFSKHIALVSDLPKTHRDPFDRMLIAQAVSEPLRLITSDTLLKNYSELVEVI